MTANDGQAGSVVVVWRMNVISKGRKRGGGAVECLQALLSPLPSPTAKTPGEGWVNAQVLTMICSAAAHFRDWRCEAMARSWGSCSEGAAPAPTHRWWALIFYAALFVNTFLRLTKFSAIVRASAGFAAWVVRLVKRPFNLRQRFCWQLGGTAFERWIIVLHFHSLERSLTWRKGAVNGARVCVCVSQS